MGNSEDGLKNYFTPWYHAKYDSTFTWFEGMNYPYGDHIVFADAQPLLSNSIKIVGLGDYTMGLLNLFMIFSLIPTGFLLFKILQRWGLKHWTAAIAAATIAFLSPQILRMNGHYALAYTFVVPLIWYLVLRFWDSETKSRSLLIAAAVFLLAWIHPYYLMISVIFLSAFWLFQSLLDWRGMPLTKRILHFGLQVIVPSLVFFLILKLTDPITDRPSNPYGFEEFHASWRSIFLPFAVFWESKFVSKMQSYGDRSWEGIGYVGITGGILFVGFICKSVYELIRTGIGGGLSAIRSNFKLVSNKEIGESNRVLLTSSVLAGLAIGIFSCGFPFSIKPELMTMLFPPIKQFRSLGRFAWAFYYVWSVFAFYLIHRLIIWAKDRKMAIPAYFFAALLLSLSITEGILHNTGVRRRMERGNIAVHSDAAIDMTIPIAQSPWLANVEHNEYSALMILPYFHVGSENLAANPSKDAGIGFRIGIQTGLPMMNVMMSRTSFDQTWKQIQYTLPPYSALEILSQIKDSRPILAIRKGNSQEFDGAYLQAPITESDDPTFKVYGIDLNEREKALLPLKTIVPNGLQSTAFSHLKSSKPSNFLVIDNFEDSGDTEGYRGGKGKTISLRENNIFYHDKIKDAWNKTYVVSFWAKIRGDQLPATKIGIEEKMPSGEDTQWTYLLLAPFIREMDGEWALIERETTIKSPENVFKVNITRWKRWPVSMVIDDFMIREKDVDIYELKDNQPIRKNLRFIPLILDTSSTNLPLEIEPQ